MDRPRVPLGSQMKAGAAMVRGRDEVRGSVWRLGFLDHAAEDRFVDGERPIEVCRLDQDVKGPWILCRVDSALSRTLFIYGFLKRTAADSAIESQPEGSTPFGSLIFRVPTHPQRARQ